MNSPLLSALLGEAWVMEPRRLESFLAEARRIDLKAAPLATAHLAAGGSDYSAGLSSDEEGPLRRGPKIEAGVAHIEIKGVLLKKVPTWVRWYGIAATGYDEIRSDLAAALASDARSIRLVVESPGGQVAGSQETADAIFRAGLEKPVTAEIEDLGASGAYWLASQAGRVSANPNAIVGSIGVYTAFVDSSRAAEEAGFKVHLVASGPHKGMGTPGVPITDDQLAAYKRVVDGMAAAFVASVARGRRVEPIVAGAWATGQVWLAGEAKELGLLDEVVSKSATTGGAPRVAVDLRGAVTTEDRDMDQKPAENKGAGAEEALRSERERLSALKAAFPDDLGFAVAEYEKGSTLESAKAAYADVLDARLKAERAEKAKLEERLSAQAASQAEKTALAAKAPLGVPPVAFGASPEAVGDFMEVARKYAEEKKVGIVAAMSWVARTRPKLHADYLAAQQARAPEVRERKIKLGMA